VAGAAPVTRRKPRQRLFAVRYYDAGSATYWRPVRVVRVIAASGKGALRDTPEAELGGWRTYECLGPVGPV